MKLSNDDIRAIIDEGSKRGLSVGLRDISYAMLERMLEEPVYAFRSVFGDNPQVSFDTYRNSNKAMYVSSELYRLIPEGQETAAAEDSVVTDDGEMQSETMSFDEIKAGLETDLKMLEELRDSRDANGYPSLDPKEMATVIARIADIRTKLVERFGSSEKKEEQRVIVMQKYNDICPHCGREVAIDPTHRKIV